MNANMVNSLIDVDNLTEEEKKLILSVVRRDEELRNQQDQRASTLRTEIHNLRMQSVLKEGDDLNKMCARCHKPFGLVFDSGDVCPQCKFKVCKMCRETTMTRGWLCTLCYKQMQLKWLTGEWIYGPSSKHHSRHPSGTDVVKASLRLSVANGNVGNANDVDGSSNQKSQDKEANKDGLERVGYPQDGDKKRLSHLFDTLRGSKSEEDASQTTDVKHVSCRRHRDSDSSSSSSEDETVSAAQKEKGPSSSVSFTSSDVPKSDKGSVSSISKVDSPTDNRSRQPSKLQNGTHPMTKSIHEHPEAVSPTAALSDCSDGVANSATESAGAKTRRTGAKIPTETARQGSAPPTLVAPHSEPKHVRRTSSEKSDASSFCSARTASPATKMRLLDLASSRALEREMSDNEENTSRCSQEGSESLQRGLGSETEDVTVEELSKVQFKRISKKVHSTSPRKTKTGSQEKILDDGGSVGGDSGHISATSQDNTPEHRGRSPRHSHLSIPSIVTGSADERDDDEDIDKLVASHRSSSRFSGGGSHSNLHSHFGDSRESIYSIYSDAGEINYGKIPVSGEILFGLDYNYKTGSLEITVKQCKDIAAVDTKRKRSDPYVKTYLLPDRTRTGKRKTKIKKHTLNPQFDEVLRYSISKSELENRVLWLTVWHNDKLGRNDFLGEVMVSLDCYKFGDASPCWYPLQERLEAPQTGLMAYRGDVIFSIKFVPADKVEHKSSPKKSKSKKTVSSSSKGELHVVVKEARNLTAVRSNGSSDTFCKGYLLPEKSRSAKQKTPVVRKNCNPSWQHMFTFEDVDLEELADRSLELTVWDYDKLTSNDFLGGIRLNLGLGTCFGKLAEWMDARGEEITTWQSVIDRPNAWVNASLPLRSSMGKQSVKK